jgi:hypothetical protein
MALNMIYQLSGAKTIYLVELYSTTGRLPLEIKQLVEGRGLLPPITAQLHALANSLTVISFNNAVL